MKVLLKVAMVVCFISLISTCLVYAASECNARCCDEEYPKLIVQGEGKIETLADKANFNVRIRVEEKKLERAFEISTTRINSLSETLVSSGVKKEDIKNLGYIYHPLYEGKKIFSTIDRPTSYEVIYTLRITVYNLDNLGKVLTGLSDIPETTVCGLEYTSTKIEELKKEVLKKAATDAREKAMKLTEGAGAILGKVMKIEVGAQQYGPRMYDSGLGQEARLMKYEAEKPIPQIESGSLEIIGSCVIYYSIQ